MGAMLWIPASAGMTTKWLALITGFSSVCVMWLEDFVWFDGISAVVDTNKSYSKSFQSFGEYFMCCSSLYSFEEIP